MASTLTVVGVPQVTTRHGLVVGLVGLVSFASVHSVTAPSTSAMVGGGVNRIEPRSAAKRTSESRTGRAASLTFMKS